MGNITALRADAKEGQQLHAQSTVTACQQLGAVLIDSGDRAAFGCGNGFGLIHFEQIHHQIFIFLPLADEPAIGCGVAYIAELHEGLSCLQLVADADIDAVYSARIGGGVPGIIDIQLSGAKNRSISGSDLNGVTHRIVVIFHRNGHAAGKVPDDFAVCGCAVGESHSDSGAGSKGRLAFQIHCHDSVQTEHCQSTVLQHNVLYGITLFGIQDLDGAAGQRG